jgi:hypothetical protein
MPIPKHWQDHIEAWQGSGLKQADYCRQHHINYVNPEKVPATRAVCRNIQLAIACLSCC